uniref:Uncharacterized protein n=1 Tax=Amphimedon queenslandica TaxID=400682 RepID=A0A1X7VBJ3_AMPQE
MPRGRKPKTRVTDESVDDEGSQGSISVKDLLDVMEKERKRQSEEHKQRAKEHQELMKVLVDLMKQKHCGRDGGDSSSDESDEQDYRQYGMQISRFRDMWICRFADSGFADLLIWDLQICRFGDLQIDRFVDLQMWGFAGMQIC